jgi:hypothetical protein
MRNQALRQFADPVLVEMRPDDHQAGGDLSRVLQRQKQQFRLIAHLLKRMHLAWRLGQPDKALRAENRAGQRAKKTCKGRALDRRI